MVRPGEKGNRGEKLLDSGFQEQGAFGKALIDGKRVEGLG